MGDPRDQTLTSVQSPLSPGEQRDRAVLLVSGNAIVPALSARGRLQIVGDELYLGRRAEGLPVQANVAVLDDGLVSGQHARITRASGGYDIEDLGSKNGTFVDNVRIEGRQRLRDGALVFIGNHDRRVPAGVGDRARGDQVRAGRAAGAGGDGVACACGRVRSAATAGGVGERAVHRRRDRRRQGGLRARRARGQRPQGQVRRHQLRGHPARAGGERAVRLSRRARTPPRTRRRQA